MFAGSRSTLVNMEARSISSTGLARKCVVAKLNEVTLSLYRHLVDQNIGALVILLPGHLDNLTVDEREVCRVYHIWARTGYPC